MVAKWHRSHCSKFSLLLSLNVFLFQIIIITNQINACQTYWRNFTQRRSTQQQRSDKPRKWTRKREGLHNSTWQVCHTSEEYIHLNSLCSLLDCITSNPKGLYLTFSILLCPNPIWHSNIKECTKSFSAQQNALLLEHCRLCLKCQHYCKQCHYIDLLLCHLLSSVL